MSLLLWLDNSQVNYPAFFDTIKTRNETFAGRDITGHVERAGLADYALCMTDVIQVGYVDSISIGCVASDIVLYVSLAFILGAVLIKFGMAVVFGWFLSWRLGNFEGESYQQPNEESKRDRTMDRRHLQGRTRIFAAKRSQGTVCQRSQDNVLPYHLAIQQSGTNACHVVPAHRPCMEWGVTTTRSRGQAPSMYGNRLTPGGLHTTPPGSPMLRQSRSSTSLPFKDDSHLSLSDHGSNSNSNAQSNCPFPLGNVVPQPAPDFEPFQFPLVQTVCLVTAYSESVEGLRTTLDSLATTDYPNSHKLIMVVCDGMVRGSGSKQYTPDICLGMMRELVEPPDEIQAHSYVSIADGHKRHNMAKVYAGFYAYDPETVEPSQTATCTYGPGGEDWKPPRAATTPSQATVESATRRLSSCPSCRKSCLTNG